MHNNTNIVYTWNDWNKMAQTQKRAKPGNNYFHYELKCIFQSINGLIYKYFRYTLYL